MKKKPLLKTIIVFGSLALALVALPLMSACAQPGQGKRVPILYANVPPEWGPYGVCVAMADLVSRNSNYDITARSYQSAPAIIEGVMSGEAHIGLTIDTTMAMAKYATGPFEGRSPATGIRAVMRIGELVEGFMVPSKTGIMSIPDLKGKKVAYYTADTNLWQEAALKAYGLDIEKDIDWVDVPENSQAAEELRMGRIDALWASIEGGDIMELAEATGPIRVLSIEPDKFDMMKQAHPREIGGWTLSDLGEFAAPYLEVNAGDMALSTALEHFTRADAPEDFIYTFVKVSIDNTSEVRGYGEMTKDFGTRVMQFVSVGGYHTGAIKAYKEANIWTAEMEQAQQELD